MILSNNKSEKVVICKNRKTDVSFKEYIIASHLKIAIYDMIVKNKVLVCELTQITYKVTK